MELAFGRSMVTGATTTPQGELILTVMGGLAEFESKLLASL